MAYILEASVENLQLFPGEVGQGLQVIYGLRSVS